MNNYWRETFSYFGLFKEMNKVKKNFVPKKISFGSEKNQYLLHYKPNVMHSDKVIIGVHGGRWNAGNPKFFDFVG